MTFSRAARALVTLSVVVTAVSGTAPAPADASTGSQVATATAVSAWTCEPAANGAPHCTLDVAKAMRAARKRGNRIGLPVVGDAGDDDGGGWFGSGSSDGGGAGGSGSAASQMLELDNWVNDVEKTLAALRGGQVVLLLVDPLSTADVMYAGDREADGDRDVAAATADDALKPPDNPAAATQRRMLAALPAALAAAGVAADGLHVAYTTDQANPFVRMSTYFGLGLPPRDDCDATDTRGWGAFVLGAKDALCATRVAGGNDLSFRESVAEGQGSVQFWRRQVPELLLLDGTDDAEAAAAFVAQVASEAAATESCAVREPTIGDKDARAHTVAEDAVTAAEQQGVPVRCPPPNPGQDGGAFTFYVYPDDGVSQLSKQYAAILRILRTMPGATTDPSRACAFFPPFDTTPLTPWLRGDMNGVDGREVQRHLAQLPFWSRAPTPTGEPATIISGTTAGSGDPISYPSWDGEAWAPGTNHVILDLTDSRSRHFSAGAAAFWKSGYDVWNYRRGIDVAFPALPNNLCRTAEERRNSRRLYLLSFKGSIWEPGLGFDANDTRASLLRLHNGRDVMVLDRGGDGTDGGGGEADNGAAPALTPDEVAARALTYPELLSSSVFALVPRGGGLHSYRFVETLSCGAVPVVLADDWEMPLSEVINHDSYALRVPETEWAAVPDMLRSLPASRVEQLRLNVMYAFEAFYIHPLEAALTVMRKRVLAARRVAEAAAGNGAGGRDAASYVTLTS